MRGLALGGAVGIGQHQQVEVAVADVPEQRHRHRHAGDIGGRGLDAFGQPRDRHADVGRNDASAGAQRLHRPIGVVPRLPQPGAVLRPGGPGEVAAAAFGCDLLEVLRLLGDLDLARARLAALARHPADAYASAKTDLRAGVLVEDAAQARAFLDEALPMWTSPALRERLLGFLAQRSRRG